MQQRSMKDLKQIVVVKKENQSHDANMMAQLECERSLKSQHQKRNRMENFMNNTKLNASKIYKEQQQKKIETVNSKKVLIEKQKELKARYTVVDKKKQQPRVIDVEPTMVDWKKIDQNAKGVSVPIERNQMYEDSDQQGSGIDSEYQLTEIRTPIELIKERENIRNKMLNKFRNTKTK